MTKYKLIILSFMLILSCGKPSEEKVSFEKVELSAEITFVPNSISAGQRLNAQVDLDKRDYDGKAFTLILQSSLGNQSYNATAKGSKLAYDIPADENTIAGLINAKLLFQNQIIGEKNIVVSPGKATDKIDSYNGPKSLFANDDDGTMNVSIPHDEYDNPLGPDAVVSYSSTFNGSEKETDLVAIEHLVASKTTTSKSKTGKFLIGSEVEKGYSREQEIIIEAVMPDRITIELVSHFPIADSRQFVHIKTKTIKDRLGNVVADGTIINFVVYTEGHLENVYQSFTISGIANVYIENPIVEKSWVVNATLYGSVKSNTINLKFEKNVQDFELKFLKDNLQLQIGPVFGNLGQLVPDGTEALVSLSNSNQKASTYIENGKAIFEIPFEWKLNYPLSFDVIIGGHSKNILIENE